MSEGNGGEFKGEIVNPRAEYDVCKILLAGKLSFKQKTKYGMVEIAMLPHEG